MKARFKTLIILVVIFLMSLVTGLAVGCSIGEPTARDLADGDGMTASVTYYTNGGRFTNSGDLCYRQFVYRPGQPIFNIGVDGSAGQTFTITRAGYVFAGWQYCVLNSDGLPILKDNSGNVLEVHPETGSAIMIGSDEREIGEQDKVFTAEPNGEEVFQEGQPNRSLNEGDHLFIVATWVLDIRVEYHLVTDSPILEYVEATAEENKADENKADENKKDPKYYNTGDVIHADSFGTDSYLIISPKTFKSEVLSGSHSYLSLYHDEGCTRPVEDSFRVEKPQKGNYVLYAKYREGRWTPVRESADVDTMLNATGSGGFYVVWDVEYKGTRRRIEKSGTYSGIIDGNGKTISGISVEPDSAVGTGKAASLFGNLGASAQIKNLTLKNINIKIKVGEWRISAYALFNAVAQGAAFENFNVDGITLDITLEENERSAVSNIPKKNGEFDSTHWIYDSNSDSDEEFKNNNTGLNVLNATLIINEKTISGGQHE